jgi:transposase
MDRLYYLTEEQFTQLNRLLPPEDSGRGRPPKIRHREALEGILHILRPGTPWRDVPQAYGAWHTISMRWQRWVERRVWWKVLRVLTRLKRSALQRVCRASPVVRAHQHAAGAPQKRAPQPLAARAAGCAPQCMPCAGRSRMRWTSASPPARPAMRRWGKRGSTPSRRARGAGRPPWTRPTTAPPSAPSWTPRASTRSSPRKPTGWRVWSLTKRSRSSGTRWNGCSPHSNNAAESLPAMQNSRPLSSPLSHWLLLLSCYAKIFCEHGLGRPGHGRGEVASHRRGQRRRHRDNPLLLEGQLHGKIAQGVAQAPWEDIAYGA